MSRKAFFISLIALLIPLMVAGCFADATADLKQAETYQKAGNYKEAETIYKKIMTDYPETEYAFQAQKDLAILYINTNKDSQAQTAFQELVASFPQHPAMAEALYYIAKNFNWKNKHDKAHQIHQYNADNFSDDKYALWSQIEVTGFHIQSGDDAAAADASIDKLLTVFANQHNVAIAVYQIGTKYQDAGKSYKAIELYRHVIETWPADKNALFAQSGLAISYEASGDKNAAKAAYERLLAELTQHEVTAEDIYWIAKRFNWAKHSNRAAGVHRYNVERFPCKEHAIWSLEELIYCYIRTGDEAAADAAIDKFLAVFSGRPAPLRTIYNIAKAYEQAGNHRKADELYQHVLDNRPADEDIYARMSASMAYIGLADEANALAVTDGLISDFYDHSDLAGVVFHIGEQYYEKAFQAENEALEAQAKENFEKALTVWEKIITDLPVSDPNTTKAYYFSAVCYRRLGQYPKAIEYYQKIVDDWPDYKYAWEAKFMIDHRAKEVQKWGSNSN